MKVFKYAIFKAFIADNYSIQIIDGVEKLVFKQALKVKNMMTERKSGGGGVGGSDLFGFNNVLSHY